MCYKTWLLFSHFVLKQDWQAPKTRPLSSTVKKAASSQFWKQSQKRHIFVRYSTSSAIIFSLHAP
jgi:hypothetical protein